MNYSFRFCFNFILYGFLFLLPAVVQGQIYKPEPIKVVGNMNGYSTGTGSNSTYRRLSVATGEPTDGRGQWAITYNVQSSGGNFTPVNMAGGSGQGFLFISGPTGNPWSNKWVFNGTAQATLNAINSANYQGSTDMGLNMSTAGRYTFVFNDCGYTSTNAKFYVAYTPNQPVTITRDSVKVNSDRTANVYFTTDAAPSGSENLFVRYTIASSFASSNTSYVVQASALNGPTNTSYMATIPAIGSISSTVRYYVFSSTMNLSALNSLSELERTLAAIRYDDSLGLNYQYNFSNSNFVSVQSGNFTDPATWGGAFVSGGSYIISSGHTVTLDANASVSNLTIQSGGTFVGSNGSARTLTLADGAVFSNSGTFTSGSLSTLSFSGTGTFSGTFSGTSTTGHVRISGGVNFGSSTTIGQSLTILAGGFVQTNPPIYGTGSTLIYSSGGSYGRGLEWSSTSAAGYPFHVQLSNSTTLNLKNNANTARSIAGNLTLDTSTVLAMQDLTIAGTTIGLTIGGNIVNQGTINMGTSTERILCQSFTNQTNATTTLSSVSGGDLEIQGSLVDNGTFNSNSRAVFFSGASVQDISGSGIFGIDYLVSNKSGGRIRLLSNLLCEGPNGGNAITLTNSSDYLDLNGYSITIGKAAVNSGITGNGFVMGSASSSFTILGIGAFGTLRFDSATAVIGSFICNRSSSGTLTLGSSLRIVNALTLTQGTVTVAAGRVLSYEGNSFTRTGGSLQLGNAGTILELNQAAALTIPSGTFSGSIAQFHLNGAGVSLSSSATISEYLLLNGGNLELTGAALLSISSVSDTAIRVNSGYVKGALNRTIPASLSGLTNYPFPIGFDAYTPAELIAPITTSSGSVSITIQVVDTGSAGTAGPGMSSISNHRYWFVSATSGASNLSGTAIRFTEESIGSFNSIARSATLSGTYLKQSSLAPSGNSITTSVSGNLGYFSFGEAAEVLTSVQSGNFTDPATWGVSVFNGGGAYRIASGHTVTLNGPVTSYQIQIDSGAVLVGDNGIEQTLSILSTGTFSNSGTYTSSTHSNLSFLGSGTISGTVNLGRVRISGGVDFGNASTVTHSLSILPGGFVNTNPPRYATDAYLIYASGGSYGRGFEWSTSSGAGYPYHVQISNGTNLLLKSGADVSRFAAGNLVVDSAATLSFQDLTVPSTAVGLTLNGNVLNFGTINMGTSTERLLCTDFTNYTNATISLSATTGGDLELRGSLIDNGTFNANSRAVFFSGTGVQEVSGSGTFSIDYLVSQKSSGVIRMLSDLLCEGPNGGNAITLSNASDILELNGFSLTLGKAGVNSVIAGNGSLTGTASSSLQILGTGNFGTLRFTSGGRSLNNLVFNRTSSGSVSIATDLSIHGNLVLTQGTINMSSSTQLVYLGNSINRTGGSINASASACQLEFGNSSALTVPANSLGNAVSRLRIAGEDVSLNSGLSISEQLSLSGGKLLIANGSTLAITNTSDTAIQRSSGFVSGSLRRVLPAGLAGSLSYLFPVGNSEYTPAELVAPYTGAGGSLTLEVLAIDSNAGGSTGIGMQSLDNARYWNIQAISGAANLVGTKLRFSVPSIGSLNALANATTLSGTYVKVNSNPVTGNSIMSDSLNSLGFFVLGNDSSSGAPQLNLTVFFEGLYLGSGTMTPAPYNFDNTLSNLVADSFVFALYHPTNLTQEYQTTTLLGVDGTCSITLPSNTLSNDYYLVVRHRNSIETWSAVPVTIAATNTYDFSSAASQAYGDNMVDLGSGVFGIYSGDINQDGSIDFLDYPDLDTGALNGDLGYLVTDLNGDSSVDFLDYPLIDVNALNGVISLRP